MKRAIIIVLDSVGIGELPDAAVETLLVLDATTGQSRRCVRRRACPTSAP